MCGETGLGVFTFPKDSVLREKWNQALLPLNFNSLIVTRRFVCKKHFGSDCVSESHPSNSGKTRIRLRYGAVPELSSEEYFILKKAKVCYQIPAVNILITLVHGHKAIRLQHWHSFDKALALILAFR